MDRKTLYRTALDMAWPSIVESFFGAFTGLVDSLMVSSLGASAVAAVGLTAQPKFLFLSLFFAVNVATAALVARRKGEEDRASANRVLVTALLLSTALVVFVSLASVLLSDPILRWSGSEPDSHAGAVAYYRIVMGGVVFSAFSMVINSAQRGAGNTRIAMRTNVVSNLLNIVFNYLLINGRLGFPAMGIEGAALATVLGTVVACWMSFASILKPDGFLSLPYALKERIRATGKVLASIVHLGYSVVVEQMLMRVGFFATAIMAAKQGTAGMAAHQVGMNILGLSFSFGDGLQAAAVALIGRSLGQKSPDLAKQYGRACRMIGGAISAVLAVLYWCGGGMLYRLFFADPEIVAIGVDIMHVVMFITMFQIAQVVYMGSLRGAGDTAFTAFASTISVTLVRSVFGYVFCYPLGLGMVGIWLGVLADQISRYLFGMLRFRAGKWVDIKI